MKSIGDLQRLSVSNVRHAVELLAVDLSAIDGAERSCWQDGSAERSISRQESGLRYV